MLSENSQQFLQTPYKVLYDTNIQGSHFRVLQFVLAQSPDFRMTNTFIAKGTGYSAKTVGKALKWLHEYLGDDFIVVRPEVSGFPSRFLCQSLRVKKLHTHGSKFHTHGSKFHTHGSKFHQNNINNNITNNINNNKGKGKALQEGKERSNLSEQNQPEHRVKAEVQDLGSVPDLKQSWASSESTEGEQWFVPQVGEWKKQYLKKVAENDDRFIRESGKSKKLEDVTMQHRVNTLLQDFAQQRSF